MSQFQPLLAQRHDKIRNDWFELLRIPSISPEASPANKAALKRCAALLLGRLKKEGFKSELIRTSRAPVVYGEWIYKRSAPTILIYGHYDVQPAGPATKWMTKTPFKPKERNGRVYARGAQDNKGQFSYLFAAVAAMKKEGLLKCNIKVVLEGGEEISSPDLISLLKNKDFASRLKSDMVLLCDTDGPAVGAGGLTMSLRGVVALIVKLNGPKSELHSGMMGGVGPNPATELGRVIASIQGKSGNITIKGFNDNVRKVDPQDAARIIAASSSAKDLLKETGWKALNANVRKPGISIGLRPAFDPTLLKSGAEKNSIPTDASARLTFRLVPDQAADRILGLVKKHIQQNLHPGLGVTFSKEQTGSWFYQSADDPRLEIAADAIRAGTGKEPGYMYEGGSLSVVVPLQRASGNAAMVLLGFGRDRDKIHAVNESFGWKQFNAGFVTVCELLARVA